MDAQVDGRRGRREIGEWAFEIGEQGSIQNAVERVDAAAGGGGIAGVGFEQNGGTVAAQKVAGEVFGDVDEKLNFAAQEHFLALGFGLHLLHKIEVGAVFQALEKGASMRAGVGKKHGGGHVARVGVDHEPKNHELHDRDP